MRKLAAYIVVMVSVWLYVMQMNTIFSDPVAVYSKAKPSVIVEMFVIANFGGWVDIPSPLRWAAGIWVGFIAPIFAIPLFVRVGRTEVLFMTCCWLLFSLAYPVVMLAIDSASLFVLSREGLLCDPLLSGVGLCSSGGLSLVGMNISRRMPKSLGAEPKRDAGRE